MFKKILIVILILLFIGVLSINITVNTDTSAIEEDIEENTEELEGFSFDNRNVIVEEIQGKIREPSKKEQQVSSNSFIKLQGKVKELDHAVYDLKNEIKSTNISLENKLDNTVQRNELDNKIKLYQKENKKAIENSEKNQNDKLKSLYLDNKVDKLEEKKRDSAQAKAINDNFRKYSGAF